MEEAQKKQVQEYLELCQRLTDKIRKRFDGEIESAEAIREHAEKYLEMAEDTQMHIQRIIEYLELRKRAINEFFSHLFWVKQAITATNAEETFFYLRNALEGLIDMETLVRRENELTINFDKKIQDIREFIDFVEETQRELEDYQKFHPELLQKLEEIMKTIKKTSHPNKINLTQA
ncbi:MAG: hypothetical protein KIH08_07120 [Candidatus Freyarchaeota archaeon]|nr:hypothetical protein [Candidatus Jordarchaeia archaeon]MBS7269625.1 hypothetical protein [Candidatus Jordarchaeia archaeon]MBS7281324.1 hypothetical protein [Candidatus Jordarchaeia archaeon]